MMVLIKPHQSQVITTMHKLLEHSSTFPEFISSTKDNAFYGSPFALCTKQMRLEMINKKKR